ncbi:HPP family protein [Cupriavidus numazuensis]|uniref:Inosine-5'-monophosphate dehydrogenase n=1 Tax=Cupriavidus numazuensis TaxID=221992 RepID=A0ABM8TCE5_9BURK|nr:HPP family protein [Cupriavidus numazuensis]CAG2135850.1 Inosine-5'-monophosphate dehydrogenase [Cupriavidus numazuensis]
MPTAPAVAALAHSTRAWLRTFVPLPVSANRTERIKSCIGALLGLFLTEWISHQTLGGFNPWFVAPMGASAVLLFAVPSSPLAQPWSIIGGNLFAALVGVACARWIPDQGLAAATAVAVAIAVMFQFRCVHPPSGAVAITAVFGGPAVSALGFGFVAVPVLFNSMLLLLMALAFNNLSRRRYPHRPPEPPVQHHTADVPPGQRVGFTRADLHDALQARGEFLDIEEDDLEAILVAAQLRAYRRHFGNVLVSEIMSRDVVTVNPSQPATEASHLLTRHRIKALPVVDEHRKLLGIITQSDFFAAQRDTGARRLAGTVRDLMTRAVVTARAEQPMVELAQAFSDGGLHHAPVIDDHHRVVGMVTQSDLVAALLKDGVMSATA